MKDVIAMVKKTGENKELLVIENINKTIIAEVVKVSNTINLGSKYS